MSRVGFEIGSRVLWQYGARSTSWPATSWDWLEDGEGEGAGLEIDYCSGNICIVLWRVDDDGDDDVSCGLCQAINSRKKINYQSVVRDYESSILDLESQTTSGTEEELLVGWGLNCLPTESKRESEREGR